MGKVQRSSGALSVGAAAIQVLIFWFLVLALVIVAQWSLGQTIEYAIAGFGPDYGPWIGILVQFWQNFAIFMANRSKTVNEKALWWLSWGVSAVLDATTNVGQYHQDNGHLMQEKPLLYWMAQSLCVLVIGVEEVLSLALAAALHKTNDLIEAIWGERFSLLEWVEEGVEQTVPRFGSQPKYKHPQPTARPTPPARNPGYQNASLFNPGGGWGAPPAPEDNEDDD